MGQAYRCPICGQVFCGQGALSHLKSHFQRFHVPLPICPVCGQRHPSTQHFFANLKKRPDHLPYAFLYAMPSYGKGKKSPMETRLQKRQKLYESGATFSQ